MGENQSLDRPAVPLSVITFHAFCSLIAVGAMAGAVLIAFHGGTAEKALVAASLGVVATIVLSLELADQWITLRKAVQDFLIIALIALSGNSRMFLWQAPAAWGDLVQITAFTSSLVIVLYFLLIIFFLIVRGYREPLQFAAAVLDIPLIFNWLLLLQAPVLLQQAGAALGMGFSAAPEIMRTLGRVGVLCPSAESPVGFGCFTVMPSRESSTGRLPRRCSASIWLCSLHCCATCICHRKGSKLIPCKKSS